LRLQRGHFPQCFQRRDFAARRIHPDRPDSMPQPPHAEFARRLHRALDTSGFAAGRRRTGALSEYYGVSRETARKWLGGLALPELDR